MNAPLPHRVYPQALDAERALLGGVLLDWTQMEGLCARVTSADFYMAAHGRLWDLLRLWPTPDGWDVLAVAEALLRDGSAERVGGLPYVTSLPEQCVSTVNLDAYADIVRDRSIRRGLMLAAQKIVQDVAEGSAETPALLDAAERAVLGVTLAARPVETSFKASLVLDEVGMLVDERWGKPCEIPGVSCGLKDLDRQLGGLRSENLIILAGRPGMGKTALAMRCAVAVAQAGHGVLVFSLEMSRQQLMLRALCSEARVDSRRVETGKITGEEKARLDKAINALYTLPMEFDDRGGVSVLELRSQARRISRRMPLGLIVVDYLQLLAPLDARAMPVHQVAQNTALLKALAKEMKIPVIVLSQLNRGVEARQDKRPLMSDLRDSGAIEQDADSIVLLYREAYYKPETEDPLRVEANVAKNRHGAPGLVNLNFEPEFCRFDNRAYGRNVE